LLPISEETVGGVVPAVSEVVAGLLVSVLGAAVVSVLEAAVVSVEAAGKVVVTASEPGVTTDVLLDPLAPDPQAASESTRSKTEPATVIFSRALLTIPPVSANAWAAWGAAHAS
jgi:hypothetical protein